MLEEEDRLERRCGGNCSGNFGVVLESSVGETFGGGMESGSVVIRDFEDDKLCKLSKFLLSISKSSSLELLYEC